MSTGFSIVVRQVMMMMIRPATPSSLLLLALYATRVLLCFLPQHGYIQPDEFFQMTEPAAARALDCRAYLAWEVTRAKPIRSTVFILLTQLCFQLLSFLVPEPSAYLLLLLPRLMITCSSFACDWALVRVMESQKRKEREAFFCRVCLNQRQECSVKAKWFLNLVCFLTEE